MECTRMKQNTARIGYRVQSGTHTIAYNATNVPPCIGALRARSWDCPISTAPSVRRQCAYLVRAPNDNAHPNQQGVSQRAPSHSSSFPLELESSHDS